MRVKSVSQAKLGGMIPNVGAVACALLLSVSPLALTPVEASSKSYLGQLNAGDVARLPFSGTELSNLTLSQIEIEINGVKITDGIGKSPAAILIELPSTLTGQWQQIAVYDVRNQFRKLIGTWDFEVATGAREFSATLNTQLGANAVDGAQELTASGGGSLNFDVNGGRSIGSLNYSIKEDGARVDLDSWFTQQRFGIAGQNGYLRFGDHAYNTSSKLIGNVTKRGASLRVISPSRRHDTSLFVMGTSDETSQNSFLGFDEPTDRIYGLFSNIQPFAANNYTLGVTAVSGTAKTLADNSSGDYKGAGLALLAPVSPYFDIRAQFDRSYSEGTEYYAGSYASLDTDMSLLPNQDDNGLILSLGYSEMDQAFFTPMSSLSDKGQRKYSLGVERYTQNVILTLNGSAGYTNHNGPATNATDRISKLSVNSNYIPDSRNGEYSAGGSLQRQDRLDNGTSGTTAQDYTIWSYYFGYDRVRDKDSFALQFSFDYFDDRMNTGLSERKHSLEAFYTRSPLEKLRGTVTGTVTHTQKETSSYFSGILSGSLQYELKPDALDYLFNLSLAEYEDPSSTDGLKVGTGLSWQLNPENELVTLIEYGEGSQKPTLASSDGLQLSITLRSNLELK